MKRQLLKKLHLKKVKKLSKLDQFLFSLVGLGALTLVIFIGHLVYFSWPKASVATFLPAKGTVMYLEINDLKLPTKLEAGENHLKMIESFSQPFGLSLPDFTNNGLAYALIKEQGKPNQQLLFIRTKTKRGVLKHFESMLLSNEALVKSDDENPIYTFPQSQSFAFRFVDGHVVIGKSTESLKLLDINEGEKALSEDEDYLKSINNLPRRSWILGYVDFKNLDVSENIAINNIVEPLKHALRHVAFTVRKDQRGFHFNTFVNLNKNLLSFNQNGDNKKFSYELTNYLLEDGVALYLGGANLQDEWLNTLESISNLNPAYGVILEGMLRSQANEVFGSQIDLRNDIYPLFQGEYAVTIGSNENGRHISLILSHDDREFVEIKLKKLAQGFRFLAAKFAPKVKTVELPDGTVSRELVPDDSKLEASEEEYEGYTVSCVEVSETTTAFCYTVTDEIIMMTNSKERLLKTLDLEGGQFLSEDTAFRTTLGNLSKVSDEVTYVNFEHLYELLGSSEYAQVAQPLLSKLEAGSWVKHYFDDGVSTEGYILVK